jgi:hypothetical protein
MNEMNVIRVFEVPNSTATAWVVVLLLVPLLALVVLLWPRPLRIEVLDGGLRIRGSLYGRTIPRDALFLDRAKVVDIDTSPELAPKLRTNGIGLPSYQVGWFRLKNGERALCFLTRRDSVVYLPTSQDYVVLTSVTDPAALLGALRQAAR